MFCVSVCPQPFGVLAIQLAHYHGVKVLSTAHSPDDQKFLEQLRPSVGEEYTREGMRWGWGWGVASSRDQAQGRLVNFRIINHTVSFFLGQQ